MTWLAYMISGPVTSVTPIDAATGSIVGYIASFGVLGYVALALVFGWLKPGRAADRERTEARADLEKELADAKTREERLIAEAREREDRLIAERKHAEEQRDDALRIARTELVPVLTSFKDATGALIPLLQAVVASQEGTGGHSARRVR